MENKNGTTNDIFSGEESLNVINMMIAQARGNLARGEGKYFILWGYLIAAISIGHFILFQTKTADPWQVYGLLWIGFLVAGIVPTVIFAIRDSKKQKVRTYADNVISTVWITFGVCAISASVLIGGSFLNYPVITLLYTFALAVSATAYRFRWMFACVAVTALCVIAYRFVGNSWYPLVMAVAMIAGNVVPGHIINKKAKSYV